MDNFNDILKESGLTGKELSGLLGLTYGSYRSSLSDGRRKRFPKWAKAFMIGFELGKNSSEKKSDPSGNVDSVVGRKCAECTYEVLRGGEFIVVVQCPKHIGGFSSE